MNTKQILKRFKIALEIFYEKEKFLIDKQVSERALTHKLAEHLQTLFPCYDVDCEYNKVDEGDPKRIMELMAGKLECPNDCSKCSAGKCVVFPDIIVHHRGKDDNLLVIEAKTEWNENSANHDYEKLKALTSSNKYHYQLGISFRFCDNYIKTIDSIEQYPKLTATQK